MDVLQAPAVFDKLDRQPIEQLRMRRPLALHAKIVRRGHDPAAEVMLPESVDDHASGQRMIGPREPIGELRSAAGRRLAAMNAARADRLLGRRRPEKLREARRHLGFGPLPTAAFEQVSGRCRRGRHRATAIAIGSGFGLQRIEFGQTAFATRQTSLCSSARKLFGHRLLLRIADRAATGPCGQSAPPAGCARSAGLRYAGHNRRFVFLQIELRRARRALA